MTQPLAGVWLKLFLCVRRHPCLTDDVHFGQIQVGKTRIQESRTESGYRNMEQDLVPGT